MGNLESQPSQHQIDLWSRLAAEGKLDEVPAYARPSIAALGTRAWQTTLDMQTYVAERLQDADCAKQGLDGKAERARRKRERRRRVRLAAKKRAHEREQQQQQQEQQQQEQQQQSRTPLSAPAELAPLASPSSTLPGPSSPSARGSRLPRTRTPASAATQKRDTRMAQAASRRQAAIEAQERASTATRARWEARVELREAAARRSSEEVRQKRVAHDSGGAAAAARRRDFVQDALAAAQADAEQQWEANKLQQLALRDITVAPPELAAGEVAAAALPHLELRSATKAAAGAEARDGKHRPRPPLAVDLAPEQMLVVVQRLALRRYANHGGHGRPRSALRTTLEEAQLVELADTIYESRDLFADAMHHIGRAEKEMELGLLGGGGKKGKNGEGGASTGEGGEGDGKEEEEEKLSSLQKLLRLLPHEPDPVADSPRTLEHRVLLLSQPLPAGLHPGQKKQRQGRSASLTASIRLDCGSHSVTILEKLNHQLTKLLEQAARAQVQLKHRLCPSFPLDTPWQADPEPDDVVFGAHRVRGKKSSIGADVAAPWLPRQGVVVFDPAPKAKDRARQKAMAHWGADATRLTDLCRLELEFSSCDDLRAAVDALRAQCRIARLWNGFREPSPLGERCIKLLVLEPIVRAVEMPVLGSTARSKFSRTLSHAIVNRATSRARKQAEDQARDDGMNELAWRVEGEHAARAALERAKIPAQKESHKFEVEQLIGIGGGGRHCMGLTSAGRAIGFGAWSHGQLMRKELGARMIEADDDAALEAREEAEKAAAEAAKQQGPLGGGAVADAQDSDWAMTLDMSEVYLPALEYEARMESAERLIEQAEERAIVQGRSVVAEAEQEAQKLRSETLIAVGGGGAHSLLLTSNGRVFTAGLNVDGQLGRDGHNAHIPVMINLAENVKLLAAGSRHSVFLTEHNRVFTCGSNEFGQLGQALPCDPLVRIDRALAIHECCTTSTSPKGALSFEYEPMDKYIDRQKARACGKNAGGRLDRFGNDPSAATAGKKSRKKKRRNSSTGGLTDEQRAARREQRRIWRKRRRQPLLGAGEEWSRIAAGTDHTMLLTNYGRVFGFGSNARGQLGLECGLGLDMEGEGWDNVHGRPLFFESNSMTRFVSMASSPVLMSADDMSDRLDLGEKVNDVSCGDKFTVLLSSRGRVLSFGDDTYGQLGRADAHNDMDMKDRWVEILHIPELAEEVRKANADKIYTALVEKEQTEGVGDHERRTMEEKGKLAGNECIAHISAGYGHTLAASTLSQLFSCGKNDQGQLGRGGNTAQLRPMSVILERGEKVEDIHAGRGLSMILLRPNKSKAHVVLLGSDQHVCELQLRHTALRKTEEQGALLREQLFAEVRKRVCGTGDGAADAIDLDIGAQRAADAAAFICTMLGGSDAGDDGYSRFVDLVAACTDGIEEEALAEFDLIEQEEREEQRVRLEEFRRRRGFIDGTGRVADDADGNTQASHASGDDDNDDADGGSRASTTGAGMAKKMDALSINVD